MARTTIRTEDITASDVTTAKIEDDAVTADKLANSINTEITANTAKVTNATHTGDVTGATALTIAADAVTPAKMADSAFLANRNYVMNGNFDVWQRGTSFAGMVQSYTNYQADRWQITPSGNSAVMTVSRQTFAADQTDVPNHPNYFCRCDVTTAASSAASGEVTNKIEDVRTLAGKPVVLTFWAKTVSGTTTMTFRLKQNFGSGGSGDAYTSLGNAALTTSWQKFTLTATCASISGKTVGANSYLGVNWYWNNNSTTTDDIDLAQFQLEEGTLPTLFEYKSYGQELAACQRYYQIKGMGLIGGIESASATTGTWRTGFTFHPEMRAAPTAGVLSGQITYNRPGLLAHASISNVIAWSSGNTSLGVVMGIGNYNTTASGGAGGQLGIVSAGGNQFTFSAEL